MDDQKKPKKFLPNTNSLFREAALNIAVILAFILLVFVVLKAMYLI